MTLKEFIEKVKLENSITFDTDKLAKHITNIAKEQQQNNVAVLSDDDVKELIINYREEVDVADDNDTPVIVKTEKRDMNKDENQKSQISLFEL